MASKLTEEERQEAAERYQSGESLAAIAPDYQVCAETIRKTVHSLGQQCRPLKCLSIEEKAETVRLYEEGFPCCVIGEQMGIDPATVTKIVKKCGATVRSIREWQAIRQEKPILIDLANVSKAAWEQAYRGLGSGYPAVNQLAQRYGVSWQVIADHLDRHGIDRRTMSEQQHLDSASGRRQNWMKSENDFHRYPHPERNLPPPQKGKRLPKSVRAKIAATKAANRPLVTRHCDWCGESVVRIKHRSSAPFVGCCRSHVAHSRWRRLHGEDGPRPLIVDRLRELLRQEPFKALPFTRETVEKAGATIGAQEAEVFEVFYEMSAERGLLEKVINAPPMARGGAKKPRQKPAISPKSLGAVGEAMLRAEREKKGNESSV